ncbi:MAG TPA: pyruvate kinase [Acidimicrobiia bacterium]|nr:pyruvate kinase [Acidimicrobiia bacterium]
MERLTKIVATLGPAVSDPESVRALVAAGMDVARLNFSHGDHALHADLARFVREAAAAEGRVVAILQDIQGPKLRVGAFPGGRVTIPTGAVLQLVMGRHHSEDPGRVYIDYDHLLEDLEPGERVLLADGLIHLVVEGVESDHVVARVVQGGELGDGKGVAFPDTNLRVPAITEKDRRDLDFGQEIGVDYVAASFVRTGSDIRQIRELAGGTPVIAKIELAVAYQNLDDILTEAAGAMVARGDLGVQLPLERIPLIQADIIRRTNAAGLVSITATEMLESMTKSPRPTRAEVTDVATAVQNGTDAVMLSAETAVGDFPVESVKVMGTICAEVERGLESEKVETLDVDFFGGSIASAVARSAVRAAADLGIDTIVAFTESGNTARLLSKYRPAGRIVGFTPVDSTLARMALYRGVQPFPFGRRDYTDVMIAAAEKFLEKEGICERGSPVVMVAGIPPNLQATTNLMKVHVIGERDRGAPSQKSGRESPEVGGPPGSGGGGSADG